MMITEPTAKPIPTQLTSGRSPPSSARIDSIPTYGASTKNWTATSFWARVSAASENIRVPVKRQMMMVLAKPSTALSRPKPISATEPAAMPATMATAPSIVIQPRLSQESSLTLPARRAYWSRPGT
jgi:hypothetical protein